MKHELSSHHWELLITCFGTCWAVSVRALVDHCFFSFLRSDDRSVVSQPEPILWGTDCRLWNIKCPMGKSSKERPIIGVPRFRERQSPPRPAYALFVPAILGALLVAQLPGSTSCRWGAFYVSLDGTSCNILQHGIMIVSWYDDGLWNISLHIVCTRTSQNAAVKHLIWGHLIADMHNSQVPDSWRKPTTTSLTGADHHSASPHHVQSHP